MIRSRLVASVLAAALVAAPLCALQSAPPIPSPDKTPRVETACAGLDVASVGARWQARLRLEDWRIEYRCEMPEKYAATHNGLSATNVDTRQAMVLVNPNLKDPAFVHEVILHELLHVLLYDLKEAKSEQVDEQVVRAVTEAILCSDKPKRKGCKPPAQ